MKFPSDLPVFKLTKWLIIGSCFLVLCSLQAEAQDAGVPITCYSDKHTQEGRSAPKQFPCHNADIESALKSKAVTFRNICMYVNGGWRIGTLTKPKNVDASSLTAANFKEKFPCTFGVEMIRKQSENLKVLGPSINDVVAGCAAGDKACLNTIDSSGLQVPKLGLNESVVTCYTRQSIGGTSEGSVSCSQNPSEANYCSYEDVGAANLPLSAADKKKFKGKWFVVYKNSGKRNAQICKGGVQVSDSSAESVEQEIIYSGTIEGTRNILKSAISFVPNHRSTAMSFDANNPLFVVGCHTSSGYKSCQNEGGCDMTDIKCSKVDQHPKIKDKEKTCYFKNLDNRWYYLDKHNKAPLSCTNIDVTSKPRPDITSAKSEQPNSSISLEVNTQGKSTVYIGTNSEEDKRVLSIAGDNSLEVVGVGMDALSGICSGSDCSSFKVLDFSGNKSQGIFHVRGGAQFSDNVNISKDIVVTGNQRSGGDLTVGKNITAQNISVSGTVAANSDRRLKREIREIPDVMSKIIKLRGVYYKFSEDNYSILRSDVVSSMDEEAKARFFGHQRLGFIAQEVEAVFPEVVVTDEGSAEKIKSVSYGEMSAVAIQGLKEIYLEMQEMKKEIQLLKSENKELKKRLSGK